MYVTAMPNRDQDRMRNWANTWTINFVPCTYKALSISRKRYPSWSDILLRNINLPYRDELEILGGIPDRKLNWSKHMYNITTKVRKKPGPVKEVAKKLYVMATLYKTKVRSVMEHVSVCWMSVSTTTLKRIVSSRGSLV